jgi:hypothetical protein
MRLTHETHGTKGLHRVKRRHRPATGLGLLYLQERTLSDRSGMFEKCQVASRRLMDAGKRRSDVGDEARQVIGKTGCVMGTIPGLLRRRFFKW